MDPEIEYRLAQEEDLPQVLALQEENHHSRVDAEAQIREGYVSLKMSLEFLERVRNGEGFFVAMHVNQVIGYEIPLTQEHCQEFSMLDAFVERIDHNDVDGTPLRQLKWIHEGQICLKSEWKGTGVAKELHKKFTKHLQDKGHEILLSGVSESNPRSVKFHVEKAGFKILETCSVEGDNWHVICQDLRK